MSDLALCTNSISLCAGVGGLDLGLRLALGPYFRTCCYVEREAFAAQVLVKNMAEGWLDPAPVWSDLTKFDGRRWRERVHLVFGGIPCQPASVAGKQKGNADDRWLWGHTVRVVREVEPEWFFFENVGGLFSGKVLDAFWDDFIRPTQEMGYRIATGLFTASEVGAPHKRERCFMLGRREPKLDDAESSRVERGGVPTRSAHEGQGATDSGRGSESSFGGSGVYERLEYGSASVLGNADQQLRDGGREIGTGRGSESSDDGSRHLADTNQQGLQGRCRSEREGAYREVSVGVDGTQNDELPVWPPAPSDREGWMAVLSSFPDFAPATESKPVLKPKRVLKGWKRKRPRIQTLSMEDASWDRESGSDREFRGRVGVPEAGASRDGQEETQQPICGVADGVASWVGNRTDELRACGNGVVPLQAGYAFKFLLQCMAESDGE